MEMKENVLDVVYEPLGGSNLINLLRLLAQNRFRVSGKYFPRMLYALMLSSIISPFRIMERIKFNDRIQKTEIKHDPLFIIGHWRSGTTYLHNLLSLDKNLGYCSTFQTIIPGAFIVGERFFKPVLTASIPEKRPMDDVAMGADLPQEDEYAIGAYSPYAYYNGWCFPQNMAFYNKFVCMDNVSPDIIKEWKNTYLYFLKKLTLTSNGRRLVLKNPANTARIKLLLEMFPDAQFIHIYRNPYHLYFSMMKFLRIVLPRYCIQKPPKMSEIEKHMMELYASMFKKYLREKDCIPNGNLVEVKYEEFIQQPLSQLKRIYTELKMKGFQESKEAFEKYIFSQKNFKMSKYDIKENTKEKIYNKWKFAFDAFGYEK